MEKQHIMVIGAHAGDAENMAGAVVIKHTQAGHSATIVHMTLGEAGHKTLSPAEYAEQLLAPYPQARLKRQDKAYADLIDSGEDRIGGVVIELFDADGNKIAETVTDAEGKYCFKELYPGEYCVTRTQLIPVFISSEE